MSIVSGDPYAHILDRLITDFSSDPAQRHQQELYNQRVRAAYDRASDRGLSTRQFNLQLGQRRTEHAANLKAQEENQRRALDFQQRQGAANRALERSRLEAQRKQAEAQRRLQAQQIAVQRQSAAQEQQYRMGMLGVQRQQLADEKTYRTQLLQREDEKFQFEQAERKRVREETARQFQLQFDRQKEQYNKTLAFNKERAEKEDKTRVQAQVMAEAGARKQVLSSLGFENDQAKTRSPLETLLLQGSRRQRRRLQLTR